MRCPYCGYKESKVVDSVPPTKRSSIRRRRECLSCEKRFTTYETVESLPMVVINSDGSRQRALTAARCCGASSVPSESAPCPWRDMERMALEIEQELQNSLEREVSTDVIGEKVMEKLKRPTRWPTSASPPFTVNSRILTPSMSELNKLLNEK